MNKLSKPFKVVEKRSFKPKATEVHSQKKNSNECK